VLTAGNSYIDIVVRMDASVRQFWTKNRGEQRVKESAIVVCIMYLKRVLPIYYFLMWCGR